MLMLLSMSFFSAQVTAAMYWQDKVTNPQAGKNPKSEQTAMGHGGHRRTRGKQMYLHQGEGANVYLWLPTLVQRRVDTAAAAGNYTVTGTGLDNYHVLVAERQLGNSTESAIRYVYMHGKPSGESPELLINQRKLDLEIVPSPLPREHWRYQGEKTYHFKLLFKGKPLADTAIEMVTSNGSTIAQMTDQQGEIALTLPDDFINVKAGRSNNRPANFILTVQHQNPHHQYITTYSSAYYVNPSHWKIKWEGFAVMVIGFLGGLIFIDHKRREEELS